MDHDLPAEGAIDAVHDELTGGIGHRINIVGAGIASVVDRRDHCVLEIDGDLDREWHAGEVLAGLARAVRGAGTHGLEFATELRDRLGFGSGLFLLRECGQACRAAAATSLLIVVIRSPLARGTGANLIKVG